MAKGRAQRAGARGAHKVDRAPHKNEIYTLDSLFGTPNRAYYCFTRGGGMGFSSLALDWHHKGKSGSSRRLETT